jgi:hypothetical protein
LNPEKIPPDLFSKTTRVLEFNRILTLNKQWHLTLQHLFNYSSSRRNMWRKKAGCKFPALASICQNVLARKRNIFRGKNMVNSNLDGKSIRKIELEGDTLKHSSCY